MSWYKIAIRNDYQPAFADIERYLTTIGRRKLVQRQKRRPTGLPEVSQQERSKGSNDRKYPIIHPPQRDLSMRV